MEYKIDSGIWSEAIAVPAAVVDDYIKLASGASIKVLLYMLRNSKNPSDIVHIAKEINLSEETVEDSFVFWEQLGILTKGEARKKTVSPQKIPKPVQEQPQSSADNAIPLQSATDYSPSHLKPTEIVAVIKNSAELQFLSQQVQNSFSRPLTYSELNLIIWMHDTLGFAPEIILTLCEYCVACSKANARYIETLANSWFAAGIDTFDKANDEVSRLTARNTYINNVSQLLRLKSYPSSNQCKIIEGWQTMGLSDSLILYAYDRTVDSIGSLKFPYMNKILQNWHTNGLMTREDIEAFEGSKKKKATGSTDHSYDLDKFEALAVGARTERE